MESEQDDALTGEIMDVPGVAAYLGFSSSTIYTKVRDLDIPHVRIGNVLRFPKKEIDKWLSRNTVRPADSFYNYFTQMAGHFFFERWMESRGLDLNSDPEEVVQLAEQSLFDLKEHKAQNEAFLE